MSSDQPSQYHKDNLIWYTQSDRYSLDFNSILGVFERCMKESLDRNENLNYQYSKSFCDYFDHIFKTIKGEHILHNLGVQPLKSLGEVPPEPTVFPPIDMDEAIKNNAFDYIISEDAFENPNGIKNEKFKKMYINITSIMDILSYLIHKNRENSNPRSELLFNQLAQFLANTFSDMYIRDPKIKQIYDSKKEVSNPESEAKTSEIDSKTQS